MLRTGGRRALSQLLLQTAAPRANHGRSLRVLAAAANSTSPSRFNSGKLDNVLWLRLRASITIPAGEEGDSHDDFKPVQKQASFVPSAYDAIEKDVKQNPVMVYMKGVPQSPQCGFSAMVVRILDEYEVEFQSRNVLADPELRTAVKDYSKWPTIPQVYVNGEFLGGSDILISMHRSGELGTLLKDVKKIES